MTVVIPYTITEHRLPAEPNGITEYKAYDPITKREKWFRALDFPSFEQVSLYWQKITHNSIQNELKTQKVQKLYAKPRGSMKKIQNDQSIILIHGLKQVDCTWMVAISHPSQNSIKMYPIDEITSKYPQQLAAFLESKIVFKKNE